MKQQTAWPEGVIARYLTVAEATVDITDTGEDSYWRYAVACTGCPQATSDDREAWTHAWAQSHAETCRAMPRPQTS
ncbi:MULTISPECIES: hypothetical protein [Streptomyces]|uniref:Uncharacterized protein n=2 Tax=Streptomyces rimosus subsp. rimosus TaxID=132474 RepID=L8EY48_STRR1|nr:MULTISPECIES: hypothetical protein [Streptomyces]KOG70535.1 hypothetical protein ADK78_28520 [Kitasatospora aureofaciens]MYT47315.1 hypothetical protein [Streptomyces sp. SID5471]KEF04645.1 hypothetical protein DF17_22420 [Streptomyces rimosus]KEF19935.1 hypothetical protein DF18_13950 [Streptomyces rimosus]KOT31361.1 hypothetical protein ADK84_30035 [Streptomyces sp. NRRL WC-3701]